MSRPDWSTRSTTESQGRARCYYFQHLLELMVHTGEDEGRDLRLLHWNLELLEIFWYVLDLLRVAVMVV